MLDAATEEQIEKQQLNMNEIKQNEEEEDEKKVDNIYCLQHHIKCGYHMIIHKEKILQPSSIFQILFRMLILKKRKGMNKI